MKKNKGSAVEASAADKWIRIGAGLALLVWGGTYCIEQLIALKGARYCYQNAKEKRVVADDYHFRSYWSGWMLTRTMGGHWVSAVVVEPSQIDSDEQLTVLCHFETNNYVFDRAELFEGNRIEKIKSVSSSHLDPFVVFEEFGYNDVR